MTASASGQALQPPKHERKSLPLDHPRSAGNYPTGGSLLNDNPGAVPSDNQHRKATDDVRNDGKEPTLGRIVAALTFSFWTSMLSPEYEALWQTTLHAVARKANGKGLRRKDFSGPLRPIRTLRNRIAHHEPIIAWNLPQHHAKMLELIEWLSPAAAAWCRQHCRFNHVYPTERIVLHADSATTATAED